MNSEKPFDPTKPVETRRGMPARIICTDKRGACPIVALVEANIKYLKSGYEYIQYYHNDGRSAVMDIREDLVNVPVRTSKFVSVYGGFVCGSYLTYNDAIDSSVRSCVGVLEIQFEDDEYSGTVFHPVNKGEDK